MSKKTLFYTYNQGWILGEANEAVTSGSPLSEMPWGPPFWEFRT